MKAIKKNPTNLNGADGRLMELLATFKVDSYELRERSRGGNSLYVRLRPITPPIQLEVR